MWMTNSPCVWRTMILGVLLVALGCGGPSSNADGAMSGNNDNLGNGPGNNASPAGSTPQNLGTQVCDEMTVEATHVPPNLMLVVDTSGSMNDPATKNPLDTTVKIDLTRQAIGEMLKSGQGKIRFGWTQFPSDGQCGPGSVAVEPADSSATEVQGRLNGLRQGFGGTPTGETLLNVLSSPSMNDTARANFAVLLTDGLPTCPIGIGASPTAQDASSTLQAVGQLRTASIDTFVIGLGEGINGGMGNQGINAELLNQMADAGGRPRTNADKKYYVANNMNELQTVLSTIGGMVMQCTFSLNSTPQNPDDLRVLFDGAPQNRDRNHQNGFDYEPTKNQIAVFGSACDQVRGGQVKKVDVKMGCAPPT